MIIFGFKIQNDITFEFIMINELFFNGNHLEPVN
jgi:hypothetical protein